MTPPRCECGGYLTILLDWIGRVGYECPACNGNPPPAALPEDGYRTSLPAKVCELAGCEAIFHPKNKHQKFCSPPCSVAARVRPRVVHAERPCLECHALYRPSRDDQKYCSRPCGQAAARRGAPTVSYRTSLARFVQRYG